MNKRIVIIGGMGPQASLELHKRIITQASKAGAESGSDFPEIAHVSLPIDDFISDVTKTRKASLLVEAAMRQLYRWIGRPNSNCVQYGTSIPA